MGMVLIGRGFRRERLRPTACVAALVVTLSVLTVTPAAAASDYQYGAPVNGFSTLSSCPCVAQSRDHGASYRALANEVLSHMTLAERVSFVVLSPSPPLENQNLGIPSLCIPPLSLS